MTGGGFSIDHTERVDANYCVTGARMTFTEV